MPAHHIPFEVVPGITSALAVPAYNGIPVTHRDYCSSVHIITAHSKKGGELKINFPALCALEGTLVFLMGVTSMEMVCEGLVKAGMDPQMPAAILQEGTSAVQRRVVATVSDLPQKAREANIQAPSVLIVGKVCALEKTLSWTQNRPLDGVRVVLTRPKELVSRMAHRLYELGAEVIELPAICLEPYEENPQLEQAISHISDYQWAAFTSITGVRVFFDFLRKRRCDLRALSHLRFAAIGPHRKRVGTAWHLRRPDAGAVLREGFSRSAGRTDAAGPAGAAAAGKDRLGRIDRYAAGAGHRLHRHSALTTQCIQAKTAARCKSWWRQEKFPVSPSPVPRL